MITGEMSWAFVALCFAVAGSGVAPFGDGPMYQALAKKASPLLWCVLIGGPAIALMFTSAAEWCAHNNGCRGLVARWSIFQIERSAIWRGRFCLALLCGWGYMLKVLIVDLARPSVMQPIAAGAILFMWWFYKENRRVRREIRRDTVCLQG